MASCRWAGGSGSASKLFSCSYDGSVRILDPARGFFQLAHTSEHAEYSAFDCTAAGAVLYLGDKEGNLEVLDTREAKVAQVNSHQTTSSRYFSLAA